MGFVTEETTIEGHFASAWSHTSVAYENVAFSPQDLDEFVRFVNLSADARQASLGNNPLYRYLGMVVVQVFVKPNTGQARVKELCDYVTGIFRSVKIGDIQFRVPRISTVGTRDGWYQVNVDCPYYRDEE